jgi:hypothetical protein
MITPGTIANVTGRLLDAIRTAGIPVDGVSIGLRGDSSTVVVSPTSLQAAAQPTIAAFDWSDAAQQAWEVGKIRPTAKTLLADGAPSSVLVRALAAVILDEINILRNAAGLGSRTLNQLRNAIQNKVDSGAVDT